jgi:hypothetical protein
MSSHLVLSLMVVLTVPVDNARTTATVVMHKGFFENVLNGQLLNQIF